VRASSTKRLDRDVLALAGIAAALVCLLLWPFVQGGFRFPVWPDAPVYLWWARLASRDGLSAVGARPGVPAIALAMSGALRLRLVAVVAGLEVALPVAVGVSAAAIARGRVSGDERSQRPASPGFEAARPRWLLAGLLCGAFAVHLAAGYLANLAFAVAFLGALAALDSGAIRGAVGSAILLGAGALAHPQFFAVGAVILALAAMPSLVDRDRRPRTETEFGRVGIALAGSSAVLAAGLLSSLVGARPLDAETSKDGFLRSLGLANELRGAYWARFLDRSARYVQWVSLPLAIAGLPEARDFAGRALRAWAAVTVVGVAVALATAWFPADRFITFGYVVPLLAALGVVRLARAIATARGRALAVAVSLVLVAAMLLGASIAWRRQEPFIAVNEVRTVTVAGRYLTAAPGTSALFSIGGLGRAGLFELARAANVIRAALPPDRIRAAIPLPISGEAAPDAETAHALVTLRDRAGEAARNRSGGAILMFALRPFAPVAPVSYDDARFRVAPGVLLLGASGAPAPGGAAGPTPSSVAPTPAAVAVDPLLPSSPGGIALASLAVLAFLEAAGFGWARALVGGSMASVALAPAFGLAATTLAGVVLDRLGLRLDGSVVPTVAALVACGGGYLIWFVLERQHPPQPASEIRQQPQG
jgi:hypothetical protein